MKSTFFLLSLVGSLTLAQDTCQCDPEPFGIESWPESCYRHQKWQLACYNKCGGDFPKDFGACLVNPDVPPAKSCQCDAELPGIEIYPESCYRHQNWQVGCLNKCNGPVPEIKRCAPIQPPAPKCLPEPIACARPQGPKNCECRNAIKRNKMACTKIWLELENCSAPQPEPRAENAENAENACKDCERLMCTQQWPDSCYCEQANDARCFSKCGVQPRTCPPRPSMTTSVQPPKPTGTHKPCGGFIGKKCDQGFVCIPDPFSTSCGPNCADAPGICVEKKMCGGFAGIPCSTPGQVCMDDPRDQCDPTKGGRDCSGLCVWPH